MSVSRSKRNRNLTYILNPSEGQQYGHALGVNSLQFSTKTNTLFSGGRDGVVSCWKGPSSSTDGDYSPGNNRTYDQYDLKYNSASEIRNYISQNYDNENEVVNLEQSIRSGISSKYIPYNQNNTHENDYLFSNSVQLHLDWINDMKLMSDETTIASCSSDLSVRLWNSKTNSITTLGYHKDYVKCLSLITNDTNQLVTGGLDRCLNLWDVEKQNIVSSYRGPQEKDSIYSLSSIDNLIICGGPCKSVLLFDKRTMEKPIKSFVGHIDTIRCLSIRNKYFLSGSSDSTIKLWDLRTNRILRNFDMHNSSIWSLHVPESCADNKEDFAIFYSGDKSGLLLKTDLRGCISNPTGSTTNSTNAAYIDAKFKETLGISTVIADTGCGGDDMNRSENGILSIVEGNNTIWTSVANQTQTSLSNNRENGEQYSIEKLSIKSWSIPITNKFVLYQGIKLTKNLELLNKTSKNILDDGTGISKTNSNNNNTITDHDQPDLQFSSKDKSASNEDLYDLVSQLSNDENTYDFSQIDEALSSQLAINSHLTPNKSYDRSHIHHDVNTSERPVFDLNDNAFNLEDDQFISTYFVLLNGSPSSEYVVNDASAATSNNESIRSEEPLLRQRVTENKQKLEILYEKLPENMLKLIPFNEFPVQSIKGSNAIIKSRFLNNRRQVAALDENGGIIIFDIINCSIYKTIETTLLDPSLNIDYNSNHFIDLRNDKFDEIVSNFQTVETLPQWCTVETKAGKLFITMKENNFTNCEIYNDHLYENYPECNKLGHVLKADDEISKSNIGKIVLKTLFQDFITYESQPQVFAKRKSDIERDPSKVSDLATLFKPEDLIIHTTTTANGNGNSTSSQTTTTGTSVTSKKEEEKPKRKLFGRKSSSVNGNANQSTTKVEEQVKVINENDLIDAIGDTETLLNVIQTHLPIPHVNSKVINNINIVNNDDNVPTVNLKRKNFDIVITENTISKFHCTLSELQKEDKLVELEKYLPVWAASALLLNKYPLRESPKIGFIIKKDAKSDLPGVEHSPGSGAAAGQPANNHIRLSANSMLRVSKILEFILDKFDAKPIELENKELKPSDWLEVSCRGELLPLDMTLATVKATIWKSSSDVEIVYKRKT